MAETSENSERLRSPDEAQARDGSVSCAFALSASRELESIADHPRTDPATGVWIVDGRRPEADPTPREVGGSRFADAVAARFELCRAEGDDERPLSELAYRVRYERDVALLGRELAWRQLARLREDERRGEPQARPRSSSDEPPSRRIGHAVALVTVMSACIVAGALVGLVLGSAPWR